MGLIIGLDDFKAGKCAISTNMYTLKDLNDYIIRNESKYLQELLGVDLYELFIADLQNGVPQDPKFVKIFNPFAFNDHSKTVMFAGYLKESHLVRSEGMTEMLRAFIYSEYTKEQNFKNTISGNTQDEVEVATLQSAMNNGLQEKYNNAVSNYDAIQTYICRHIDDYPEFCGIVKNYLTII